MQNQNTQLQTIMTGIKPTGHMHLGNYKGFVQSLLEYQQHHKIFLMIADGHSLTNIRSTKQQSSDIEHLVAALIACELDLDRVVIYQQTHIPQLFQIYWILNCFCNQGLLNRSHAYKAHLDKHEQINVGLYTYATLMAADILALDAELIPVGQDQQQHLEICRDLADRVNHFAHNNGFADVFKLPKAMLTDHPLLQGTDGRKMSKSYDNTLMLFEDEQIAKKKIARIATNSQSPDEPKTEETLFALFETMSNLDKTNALRKLYQQGIGWKDVKDLVYQAFIDFSQPKRAKYEHVLANPSYTKQILNKGAQEVQAIADKTLNRLHKVLGL